MPCKVTKKDKTRWLGSVMKDGRRVQKTFDTKKQALDWEAKKRKEKSFMIPMDSLTNLEWSTQYLDYSQRFNKTTFWEKQAAFKTLFKVIPPEGSPENIKIAQVLKALQPIANKQSGHAANKMRKNLIAAWNWGIKYLNFPKDNPFKIDRFPEIRKPRHVPSENDFWAVYETASEYDQRMLLAYLHTAARKSELFRLNWSDVDFEFQRIRLWTRKREGGAMEYDWIPMTDDLIEVLKEQQKHVQGDLVFPNPDNGEMFTCRQHYLERACKRSKVKKFCWHSIRHLTASILVKNGVPLPTIQKILRHKNMTTTQRYVHELDNARDMLKVLSRNHGELSAPVVAENKKASHEEPAHERQYVEAC